MPSPSLIKQLEKIQKRKTSIYRNIINLGIKKDFVKARKYMAKEEDLIKRIS